MAKTDLAVRIATILDASGLNKADKGIKKLEKRAKSLGKTLGVALSVAAIVSYGKAAARAFAEDEAAATRLAGAVKNLGIEMESTALTAYVSNMERFTGVADDQLRPALQGLLTTTKSLIASQDLLNQAINISRGSGEDLTTVANDLAQAYVGNLKGLRKYYLGLSQAELKAMSFAEIQAKLNAQFSGASAAYLETYAGKMEMLTTSSKNAQEIIGKGVIDALMKLGHNKSVSDLNEDIIRVSENFASFLVTVGKIGALASEGFSIMGSWLEAIAEKVKVVHDLISGTPDVVVDSSLGSYLDRAYSSKRADEKLTSKYLAARAAADRAAKAAAAKSAKLLAANTAELKRQATLKKAASMFDMEQIQIIAALKGKISDEERTRLELQLAIATGNDKLASDLTYKLAIAQGLTVKLAQELASLPMANNPFAAWKGYLDAIELQAKRIIGLAGGGFGSTVAPTTPAIIPPVNQGTGTGQGGSVLDNYRYDELARAYRDRQRATGQGGSVMDDYRYNTKQIVVQIDGKAIASAMQDQSLSGNQTIVNRTTGSFSDW